MLVGLNRKKQVKLSSVFYVGRSSMPFTSGTPYTSRLYNVREIAFCGGRTYRPAGTGAGRETATKVRQNKKARHPFGMPGFR